MVNKKSAFINKKNAATYHLVCGDRSQHADAAADEGDDERVLTRVAGAGAGAPELEGAAAAEAAHSGEEEREEDPYAAYPAWMRPQPPLAPGRRAQLLELGFPDDGYDYLQHCRAIGNSAGAGATYMAAPSKPEAPADAKIYDAREARRARAAPAADGALAAALARNAEVEAIEAALAAAEAPPPPGERAAEAAATASADDDDLPEGEGDLEDDFITAVLDAEDAGPSSESERDADEEEEAEEEAESDDDDDGGALLYPAAAAAAGSARERRPLDAAFDALAAEEYSDTDIGDLDHDASAARGHADVASFGGVLERFRDSAAGADALADAAAAAAARRRVIAAARAAAGSDGEGDDSDGEASEAEEDPEERAAREALQVTRLALGLPPSARLAAPGGAAALPPRPLPPKYGPPPAEEAEEAAAAREADEEPSELVPLGAGDAARERWDCESIVSTYSNLDNRPAVLDGGGAGPRRGRSAASTQPGDHAPARIRLGKTGLPVDFVPLRAAKADAGAAAAPSGGGGSDESGSESGEDVGRGAAWRADTRRKGESAEEKRARKQAVKDGRREARAQKKETKSMFKAAAARATPQAGALRPGASVVIIP